MLSRPSRHMHSGASHVAFEGQRKRMWRGRELWNIREGDNRNEWDNGGDPLDGVLGDMWKW